MNREEDREAESGVVVRRAGGPMPCVSSAPAGAEGGPPAGDASRRVRADLPGVEVVPTRARCAPRNVRLTRAEVELLEGGEALVIEDTGTRLRFRAWQELPPRPTHSRPRSPATVASSRNRVARAREQRAHAAVKREGGGDGDDDGGDPPRNRAATLPGRIEPCPADVEAIALRRFVEGMARLATRLLLDGALDVDPMVDDPSL